MKEDALKITRYGAAVVVLAVCGCPAGPSSASPPPEALDDCLPPKALWTQVLHGTVKDSAVHRHYMGPRGCSLGPVQAHSSDLSSHLTGQGL